MFSDLDCVHSLTHLAKYWPGHRPVSTAVLLGTKLKQGKLEEYC